MLVRALKTSRYRNSYLNPLGRPIDSLALNTLIEGTAEVLMMATELMGLPQLASVFVGAAVLRGMVEITGVVVDRWRFKNYANRKIKKHIDKYMIVDLERDLKFYNIPHFDAQNLRNHYNPTQIFRFVTNGYLLLNIARGFNYLVNAQACKAFLSNSVVNLAAYDPTFSLPLATMWVNYYLLKGSQHPLLIHVRQSCNSPHLVMYSFMSGLLFVPLPLAYQVGWVGFVGAHIGIRGVKKLRYQYRRWRLERLFRFK